VARQVPGLLRIVVAGVDVAGLRGARLAGDLEAPIAHRIRRSLLLVHDGVEGVVHPREVLRGHLCLLANAWREILDDRPVARLDGADELRRVDRSAVGEGGVRERELEWRYRRRALTDRRVER